MKFRIPDIAGKIYIRLIAIVVAIIAFSASYAFAGEASKKSSISSDRDFVIVIDAGHGGHDHGAIDNGTREKDINLGVAKKFAEQIKKKIKNVKVIMTRYDDTFVSLQGRADIANRNRADLFVSIHTNSVDKSNPNRTKVSGASVYSLGPQKDANNLKVAQRENSVISLEDTKNTTYSNFDPDKDESYIIFEMSQKKNLSQSLKFANLAQKELVSTAGRKDRGVKQAGFLVLWATSMPAVLVELDFICNPAEAEFLDSDKGQQKLATALTNAVESYIKSTKKSADASSLDVGKDDVEVKAFEGNEEVAAIYPSYDGVNTLVSSTDNGRARRVTSQSNAAQKNRSTSNVRKRRSSTSRQISNNREVETSNIVLKSETDFYARQEVDKEEVKAPSEPVVSDKDKGKKKKNKKKKDNKQEKVVKTVAAAPAPAPSKPASSKSNSAKSTSDEPKTVKDAKTETKSKNGRKTFTIKSSSNLASATSARNTGTNEKSTASKPAPKAVSKPEAKPASKPVLKQTAATGATVYKILVAISPSELATNDPVFGGIVPTGMFVENGEYKYTYGESTSRREIEKTLQEIQSSVPGATIIVRSE